MASQWEEAVRRFVVPENAKVSANFPGDFASAGRSNNFTLEWSGQDRPVLNYA